MDEDIPLEEREHGEAPKPFTGNLNNHTTRAVMADVRMDEERIPGMVKESTVWDVYNNEARKVDNELVKDWTASLYFLLVFAAIFAAVLTAFIIESKKMLEPDQTEILVDITIQYFNSVGNQSRTNLARPDFEPTSSAISINCLLFASLGASLVAALGSVIALQWVADYDAAITRGGSSPLDRAKRRQFRFAGVTRWKMGELIAALPLLLYSSVILFWAGAIQWMWTLHPIVGYVVAGGTAIVVIFYGSTTLLGAIFVSSPFRTPLSKGLYWLTRRSLSLVGHFLLWLLIEGAFRFSRLYQYIYSRIRSLITSDTTLDAQRITRHLSAPSPDSSPARLPLSEAIPKWIKTHLLASSTSRNREDEAAKRDPALEHDALAWLAQQLPISDDAHERLLLCASGILALSTKNPPPQRFHDAPWLAILEALSKHFMRQILDPMSSENDYQGVGILLHCIGSPFIRSKVVPAECYIRDPRDPGYWAQQCRDGDRIIAIGRRPKPTPPTFLLARDVPVPSLGSKHELEATWTLIRWRNSININRLGSIAEILNNRIWPEVFSDIGRYSPEFLESCLCHFRTWTNVLRYYHSSPSDYAVIFDSIVEQALHRDLTIGEALALARAFAGYLTAPQRFQFSETVDMTNTIPRPLSYALAAGWSSESTRATHLAITLLVVRAARLSLGTEMPQWARWVIFMLWVGISKEPEYLDALHNSIADNEGTQKVWDEIEMSSASVALEGPHVEEIARILWRADNDVMWSLTRDAFKDPQSLRYLELLLQWVPHCYTHCPGSQHILLHLYQGAESDYLTTSYAYFHTEPVRLEGVHWTRQRLNPILAMLALSDSQDLACLRFGGQVGLECAGRILEIVKTVKEHPVTFLCLLTDICTVGYWDFRSIDRVVILEAIKQAMVFIDEESATSFLRPIASMLQRLRRLVTTFSEDEPHSSGIKVEAQRICCILQAKYAASQISSTAQLRLLSCARSAMVAQPAMCRLGIHVPL